MSTYGGTIFSYKGATLAPNTIETSGNYTITTDSTQSATFKIVENICLSELDKQQFGQYVSPECDSNP